MPRWALHQNLNTMLLFGATAIPAQKVASRLALHQNLNSMLTFGATAIPAPKVPR